MHSPPSVFAKDTFLCGNVSESENESLLKLKNENNLVIHKVDKRNS